MLFINLPAQTFVNNKGNRNQSYPIITETDPEDEIQLVNGWERVINIVYLELLRRGYTIDAIKFDVYEIDFFAKKMDESLYIQVALELPENSKKETDHLLKIPDNHKKIVVTKKYEDLSEIDGIPIYNIIDWLIFDE